ncbi:MAG TPA: cupin domain-containing protein [Clostridiaceae bacterium]|nr:cupin domain-containing protein [Clostridiaceae bacterium]
MKVNFEELKELDVPNMNGGTGIVKAKMFMNKDYKIIKSVLAPNTSMGKHTQKNNEFMYVISGEAKIIIDGVEEIIKKDEVHYCPLGSTHEILNNGTDDLVLLDITVEK